MAGDFHFRFDCRAVFCADYDADVDATLQLEWSASHSRSHTHSHTHTHTHSHSQSQFRPIAIPGARPTPIAIYEGTLCHLRVEIYLIWKYL